MNKPPEDLFPEGGFINPPPPVVPNLEQARAEVLTFAKRLGDQLRSPYAHTSKHADETRTRAELDRACQALSAALAGEPL